MKMIEVECALCKNNFSKQLKHFKYAVKKGWRHICSQACKDKLGITSVQTACAQCKKTITKSPSALARSKNGKVFCTRHCATVFNNSFYKTGEKAGNYIHGKSGYRKLVAIRKCSKCSFDLRPEILQVHHKDRDRKNNKLENLEVLCPNCHMWEHYQSKDGLYNSLKEKHL